MQAHVKREDGGEEGERERKRGSLNLQSTLTPPLQAL